MRKFETVPEWWLWWRWGFHPRLLGEPGRSWARRGHTDTKGPERGFEGEPEAG